MPAEDLINTQKDIWSGGINIMKDSILNKKQMQFAKNMYEMQKNDALSFWNLQNQYNAPKSQMERLDAAGLNPNLVYGKGADVTAGPINVPSQASWKPESKELSFSKVGPLSDYQDTRLREAQINNLEASQAVKEQDALLRAAQVIDTTTSAESKKFDLGMKHELKETSLEVAREGLRKLTTGIDIAMSRNEREAALAGQSIAESVERVVKIKAETGNIKLSRGEIEQRIELLKKDNSLKKFEVQLAEKGIYKGDPLWFRMVNQIADNIDNKKGAFTPTLKFEKYTKVPGVPSVSDWWK